MRKRNKIPRNKEGYLTNYEGTYRIKADYDTSTNDFPRDYYGGVDESFDDYYIVCRNNIKIRYGCDDIFSCHIPSRIRGVRILKRIFEENVYGNSDGIEIEQIVTSLLDNKVLVDIDLLDYEVYFTFKESLLAYICSLAVASTSGAKIRALSVSNLPKPLYKIPDIDMERYKESVGKIDKGDMKKIQGLMILNRNFESTLNESYLKERKTLHMDFRSYLHYKGLWNKYINYINENWRFK